MLLSTNISEKMVVSPTPAPEGKLIAHVQDASLKLLVAPQQGPCDNLSLILWDCCVGVEQRVP